MRTRIAVQFLAAILISVSAVNYSFACQCGVGYRGKSAWENAKLAEQNATVIFEGIPTKYELRWDLLNAKDGEPIAGDAFLSPSMEGMPQMVVTFHVAKAYKGNLGSDVRVHTGLGGGDCGATYTPV